MSKCLQCDAEIKQTLGRRPRKFCDNKGKCRLAHWNKNNPKEGKYVLRSTFDALEKQLKEVLAKKYDKGLLDKVKEEVPEQTAFEAKLSDTLNDKWTIERIEVLRKEIKSPPSNLKIPKKMYLSVREKELAELENKIK